MVSRAYTCATTASVSTRSTRTGYSGLSNGGTARVNSRAPATAGRGPGEGLPGRSARLSHLRLPDAGGRTVGAVRDAGRGAARALAALQRPRHHALVRDHARRAADRRDRRHGHDLRRRRRQRLAGAGAELFARPDEARCRGGAGCAGARADRLAGPLAAVARHPVRAVDLLLPERRGRPPAGDAPTGTPTPKTPSAPRWRTTAPNTRPSQRGPRQGGESTPISSSRASSKTWRATWPA